MTESDKDLAFDQDKSGVKYIVCLAILVISNQTQYEQEGRISLYNKQAWPNENWGPWANLPKTIVIYIVSSLKDL